MTRAFVLTTVFSVISAGFASIAAADHLVDLDRHAVRLERQANQLAAEARYAFRGGPHHAHLASDLAQLQRQARLVHDIVHENACPHRLAAALREIDRLFHHVEDLAAQASRGCDFGRDSHYDARHESHRDLYRGGLGGMPYGTAHYFNRMLAGMGDTIHQMQACVNALARAPAPRVVERPWERPYEFSRPPIREFPEFGGFRIGNTPISIRFGN